MNKTPQEIIDDCKSLCRYIDKNQRAGLKTHELPKEYEYLEKDFFFKKAPTKCRPIRWIAGQGWFLNKDWNSRLISYWRYLNGSRSA